VTSSGLEGATLASKTFIDGAISVANLLEEEEGIDDHGFSGPGGAREDEIIAGNLFSDGEPDALSPKQKSNDGSKTPERQSQDDGFLFDQSESLEVVSPIHNKKSKLMPSSSHLEAEKSLKCQENDFLFKASSEDEGIASANITIDIPD
jgi:hypothetical protein